MLSRWSDADARKAIEGYGKIGVGEDLALRTYSTRLCCTAAAIRR